MENVALGKNIPFWELPLRAPHKRLHKNHVLRICSPLKYIKKGSRQRVKYHFILRLLNCQN